MASRPSQSWLDNAGLQQAIAAVGEETLLDWVEGRLDAPRIASLSQGPRGARLAATVRAMQADRASLAALPAIAAPIDFSEGVLARLDREALAALTQGPAVEDHPPISIEAYRPRRAAPVWLPRAAMAAGFLLLVGGAGLFVAQTYGLFATRPAEHGMVAMNDQPESTFLPQPGQTRGDTHIALGSDPSAEAFAAGAATEFATVDATAQTARLLAQAREGRLVIRVVARERGERVANVPPHTIVSRDGAWRLEDRVQADVLDAVRPIMHESRARRDEISQAMRSIASSRTAPAPQLAKQERSVSDEAFVLDLNATPEAFESACRALRERLGADLVFDTLPEPLPASLPADVSDLAWWNQPADHWSLRVSIPLVVERD